MLEVMNAVTFHVQADDDSLDEIQFVCYLTAQYIQKAFNVIINGTQEQLTAISKMLWFFPADYFLPHELGTNTIKLITPFTDSRIIILNHDSNQSSQYDAWIEPVFCHADAKKSARLRYKAYQQNHFNISTVKEPRYG